MDQIYESFSNTDLRHTQTLTNYQACAWYSWFEFSDEEPWYDKISQQT